MAAGGSGSVFAKQFAGRIRQVGRDGDTGAAAVAKQAPGPGAAHRRPSQRASGQGSGLAKAAPRPKLGQAAHAGGPRGVAKAAGAAPAARAEAGRPPEECEEEAEEEEEGGGVMMCANRALLQQLLRQSSGDAGAEVTPDTDAVDGGLGMSLRFVPGTPKSGERPRGVATISSPVASRAVPLRAAPKPLVARTPPPDIGMQRQKVPVPKVATGPPQRGILVESELPPRPGSRGAGTPPLELLASPSGSEPSGAKPGPPRASSYAALHALRAKKPLGAAGAPGTVPAAVVMAKPAAKPRCGPSAFDLLQQLEVQQEPPEDELLAWPSIEPGELAGLPADVLAVGGLEEGFIVPDLAPGVEPPGPSLSPASSSSSTPAAPAAPALAAPVLLKPAAAGAGVRGRSNEPKAAADPPPQRPPGDPGPRRSRARSSDPRGGGAQAKLRSHSEQRLRGEADEQPAEKPPEGLFFSRKPREVEFQPATLEEYKSKGYDRKELVELKHLGPDLDDEALLVKKAVQERMKQFSKELHKVNRQRLQAQAKLPKPDPKPEPPKANARAKALEFARHVPKPKVVPRSLNVFTEEGAKAKAAAQPDKAQPDSSPQAQGEAQEVEQPHQQPPQLQPQQHVADDEWLWFNEQQAVRKGVGKEEARSASTSPCPSSASSHDTQGRS